MNNLFASPLRTPMRALLCAALLCATALHTASAQSQRPAVAADHIVAIVNSEPVTNAEVLARLARVDSAVTQNMPRAQLVREVMEQLILERVQVQWAGEIGIKIDDAAIKTAEENVAAQNGLTLPELQQRVQASGLSLGTFRDNLRRDLLLQRLREREVDARVRVTEADIDAYVREKQSSASAADTELNLAHLLIRVPEGASAAEEQTLQQKAEQLLQRARSGEPFAELAKTASEGAERGNGGEMGLRSAERYPTLFWNAVAPLKTGDLAGPLRSGAGFHLLKVLDKRATGLPATSYTQTRARHILLRPNAQQGQDAVVSQLNALRARVVAGQARFEDLAREWSQDGSAREGGDLGWATPGQFVPEFENAMNALAPGQVSAPLVSRFGVHIIQLVERRTVEMTALEQREQLRNLLRAQKTDEAFSNWLRDLRARAYVEYRDAPQ
jgi:peptidyl-prolyl cis-trans isomerase SurA